MKALRSWIAKALVIVLPMIALAGAVALSRVTITPSANAHAVRGTAAPLPSGRFYLGVRETGIPGPWAPISRFGRAVHAHPALVLYYSNWREPFQFALARTAWAHHASLVVQIQPWSISLRAIAAGRYDSYLRSFASQVRDFGHPVVIGFGHEMNGTWYPWGYRHQPAAAFVAAWRHMVTVFDRLGARNVTWLWTISHDTTKTGPLRDYWPGARYVTWVGVDGYYFRRSDTFGSVFGPKLRQVRRLTSKPVILSETGIGQVAGQARKLPGLFAGIRRDHLTGLLWFDVAQHTGRYHQDWRLEGHPAALAAFRRGLRRVS